MFGFGLGFFGCFSFGYESHIQVEVIEVYHGKSLSSGTRVQKNLLVGLAKKSRL